MSCDEKSYYYMQDVDKLKCIKVLTSFISSRISKHILNVRTALSVGSVSSEPLAILIMTSTCRSRMGAQ